MKPRFLLLLLPLLALPAAARPGTVTFSDGKKMTGDITLTPGTQLKLFTSGQPVELPLEETKEFKFTAEKEQEAQGFYFPNAGQTTQVKTGDIYPIRYIHTAITLPDGHVVEGHLFTTVLYVQNPDDGTAQKVVLEAKQTGADGQKLSDLPYPTGIVFTDAAAGTSKLDLSKESFPSAKPAVVLSQPDLAPVSLQPTGTPQVFNLPTPDPKKIFFSIEATDGFHVAWPADEPDPGVIAAVQIGIKNMQDFYDTRKLVGTWADPNGTDIYTLVMMSRRGVSYGMDASQIPYSPVILHWNYDSDTNKANLVNRAPLGIGRANNGSPVPSILKNSALLNDISGPPSSSP
jgi:hypothetical protein